MLRTATLAALAALALAAAPARAQAPTMTVINDISANTTWTTGSVVLLDGLIYVRPGATLIIQPGVIVKGKAAPSASTGDLTSGLIVMWDARLVADGQPNQPVIFTAESDNVADVFDLNETNRGLWGGVILNGRSTNNRGVRNAEGVPTSDDTRYGCDGTASFPCDEADDSGILRYVSIRHAGFGLVANSEINGLTFNAVGSGTVVDYVEVFANSDDSYEWFGGTVNTRHLVAAFDADDSFDWDTGFRGMHQYWFSIHDNTGEVGRCGELDGAATPFTSAPMAIPVVSNLTCIGAGVGSTVGGSDAGSPALIFRDNSGGKLYNSVVYDLNNVGLTVEDIAGSTDDSRERFAAGDLVIDNNLFFGFGSGNTFGSIVSGDDAALETALATDNQAVDPQLVSVCREQTNCLDPRPVSAGPAASGGDFAAAPLQNGFFTPTTYRGAFAPDAVSWLAGSWSVLVTNEYLSGRAVASEGGTGAPAAFGFASVRPNPARGDAAVAFGLGRAQTVRLALYDVTGREVAVLVEGERAAGAQSAALDAAALAPGVYVLRLAGEEGVATRRLTVAR